MDQETTETKLRDETIFYRGRLEFRAGLETENEKENDDEQEHET